MSTPAAIGLNTGNKGIGAPIAGPSQFEYFIIDANPTSASGTLKATVFKF
ncbi:hypothetical protein [Aminobacter sp. HY435]|nr:hypothetical protein [Aminobacter sp. HY435]